MPDAACTSTIPAPFLSIPISHFGTPPFLFATFEKHHFCLSPSQQTSKHFLFDTFERLPAFLLDALESLFALPAHCHIHPSLLATGAFLIAGQKILKCELTRSISTKMHFLIAGVCPTFASAPLLTIHESRFTNHRLDRTMSPAQFAATFARRTTRPPPSGKFPASTVATAICRRQTARCTPSPYRESSTTDSAPNRASRESPERARRSASSP